MAECHRRNRVNTFNIALDSFRVQKSTKIIFLAGFLIAIPVSTVLLSLLGFSAVNLFVQSLLREQEADPFSLDDAPDHIIELKTELKDKFHNETFTWEDMPTYIEFCQWLADNSPDILDLVKDWDQNVLFNFNNASGDMWFIIEDNSLTIEYGSVYPEDYGIMIDLSFETFIDIMKQDETPLSANLGGRLHYQGPFPEVLKVSKIATTAAATIMDTNIPVRGEADFNITVDDSNLYIQGGLTLFPLMEVTINPDHLGEHHKSTPGLSSLVIVDDRGEIVAELEDTAHSVHEFINSTSVMMGGQEGFMELWNFKENILETLSVPGGHHEIDYNPVSDTFMVLEYAFSNETWDDMNVIYDLISEYNRAGELVWQWDPRVYFPFNSTRHTGLGLNETFRGGVDWMHSNSFVWDKINEVIYLNVRNLDTILKINYTSKEIIWDAGRDGDFTLINKAGEEVDFLFCHSHSLEQISPTSFIMFDNDLFNQSNPLTMTLENSSGHSRYLELEIDEENRIMREVWSWTPSNSSYYMPESGGDADRLPNGNCVGIFGDKGLVLNLRDPVIITEVTRSGDIAWELQIPGQNNTYFWVHRVERFYEKPIISLHNQTLDLNQGTLSINLSTWNNIRESVTSPGTIRIIADGTEIYQDSFSFLPYWQPKQLVISLSNLQSTVGILALVVTNNEGLKTSITLYEKPKPSLPDLFQFLPLTLGIATIVIAVPVIVTASLFLVKKYNLRQ